MFEKILVFMFTMVKPHKSITTSLIIKIKMNIFILGTGLHGEIINLCALMFPSSQTKVTPQKSLSD